MFFIDFGFLILANVKEDIYSFHECYIDKDCSDYPTNNPILKSCS